MLRNKYLFTIIVLIVGISIIVYANTEGKTGRTLKDGKGCTCHGDNPDKGINVVIGGPSTLKPNQSAEYTVTINGGILKTGGVDIAVSGGNLKAKDGLYIKNGELTHSSPKIASNGKVVFNFTYTAPSVEGKITLYATGNSSNNDETKRNDKWNFANNYEVVVKK